MINSPHRRLAAGAVTIGLALALTPAPATAAPARCRPVQANGPSTPAGISTDGRFALFTSTASNLVPGGSTPGHSHVYRRDLHGCRTVLVDVTTTGAVPDGPADAAHLSADGRYATFRSAAPALVPGGGTGQAYLRDLGSGSTELISVTADGSPADGGSTPTGVSANGRYVLFVSAATNLLASPLPYGVPNIYLRDRWQATTRLVYWSHPLTGARGRGPAQLSPDGQFVLMDEIPHRPAGEWRWQTSLKDHVSSVGQVIGGSLAGGTPNDSTHGVGTSTAGRYVLFHSPASDIVAGDTNGAVDVFVQDTVAGGIERVNVGSGGGQADADGNGGGISHDGRRVAFWSPSTNLVPGDTNQVDDVFVRDRTAGTTVRASVATGGTQGNASSDSPKISAQGRFVILRSDASNLVPNDTNGSGDVFVRDLRAGTTVRVSVG